MFISMLSAQEVSKLQFFSWAGQLHKSPRPQGPWLSGVGRCVSGDSSPGQTFPALGLGTAPFTLLFFFFFFVRGSSGEPSPN